MKRIDGQPVTNAALPIRLSITSKDIKDGAPLNPNACAIALAAIRHVPGVTAARAHLASIFICRNGKWQRLKTSAALSREIVAFDRGGKFYPGEYVLLPVSVGSLVKRARGVASASKRSRGPKRRRPHYTEGVRESAHANQPKES